MSICKDLEGVDAVKSRFLSIGSAHLDGDRQNCSLMGSSPHVWSRQAFWRG